MSRIFAALAVANLIVFLIVGGLGVQCALQPSVSADGHVLLAVLGLLLDCLIQVVSFTYLTVTGKVMAQAVHLAHLDISLLSEAKRLKGAFTRLLAASFGGILAVTASGASAWRMGTFSPTHMVLAGAMLVMQGWVWIAQFRMVQRNERLLDGLMEQYRATRTS